MSDRPKSYLSEPSIQETLKVIKSRADSNGLKFASSKNFESIGIEETYKLVLSDDAEDPQFKYVTFPKDVEELVSIKFENFRFLKSFEGTFSKELSLIEVRLNSHAYLGYRQVHSIKITRDDKVEMNLPKRGKIKFSIGVMSKDLKALLSRRDSADYSLMVEGYSPKTVEDAEAFLKEVSDPIFLQIDREKDFQIRLSPRRFLSLRSTQKYMDDALKAERERDFQISSLGFYYDHEPVTYYLRSKADIAPMFAFQSLYNAIEFYFIKYTREDAVKKIKSVLTRKDFDSSKDTNIWKILDILEVPWVRSLKRSKDDDQLKNALNGCLKGDSIRNFINGDVKLKSHLEKPSKHTEICINASEKDDHKFIGSIAARIYDIRNKVIHSKYDADDRDVALILPDSLEEQLIDLDNALMEYIVEQFLDQNKRPI